MKCLGTLLLAGKPPEAVTKAIRLGERSFLGSRSNQRCQRRVSVVSGLLLVSVVAAVPRLTAQVTNG
jgi:hypothetical protein